LADSADANVTPAFVPCGHDHRPEEFLVKTTTRSATVRRLTAISAATATAVLLGTAGPAAAVTAKASSAGEMIHLSKPSRSVFVWTRGGGGKHVNTLIDNGVVVSRVVSSPVPGSGTPEEACNTIADTINALDIIAVVAVGEENWDAVGAALNGISDLYEQAASSECNIGYVERTTEPPVG
jgi:hypothetical protein